MKMKQCGVWLVAVGIMGVGGAATAFAAEGADTATTTATPRHFTHPVLGPMPDSMLVRTTLRAMSRLNLTAAQHSQIRTILENAHAQAKASGEERSIDMAVLGNPSDPNYSSELQALKTHATNKIQQESDLQGQIVNVLTPEQKEKLPHALASIQAHHEQRRAEAEHHTDTMR